MHHLLDSFDSLANLPQHANSAKSALSYGTAGFRADADNTPLDFVMFRVGCLIGLRSRAVGGLACAAMVTASHNGPEDNGIKMVEPDGSMLDPAWEEIADRAINAKTTADLRKILEQIPLDAEASPSGLVFVGWDTRASSERLVQCLIRGCHAVNATVERYGLVTTPVLHHIVRHTNGFGHCITMSSEEGYARMLNEGIKEVVVSGPKSHRGRLIVDAAGGVGSHSFERVLTSASRVASTISFYLGISDLVVVNSASDPKVDLNENCGAEFVQKKRQPPALLGLASPAGSDRVASFDGDADRLVYSYTHPVKGWRLLDGDKIATLFALFLNTELALAQIPRDAMTVGMVQTAYANGASTHFVKHVMKNSAIEVKLAKTGVKFVEHEAKKFDIGMYFEANGHGTVIFSPHAVKVLRAAGASRILGFYKLVNQAVGDAVSDCLAVEAVLTHLNLSVEQWDELYEDLPSRQGKIAIADRTLIQCTPDETRIVSPASLQVEIDRLVAEAGPQARAFVRPSGTEDAARVYAEALSTELANKLALAVARAAWKAVGKPGSAEPREADYM